MVSSSIDFVLGFLLSWPALAVLVFFGVLFEHNMARGWAVFTAIVAAVISYFYFQVPAITLAEGAVGYLVIGVLWSFYRYKRFVTKAVDRARETGRLSDSDKDSLAHTLHPTKNLPTITAWIIIWPLSFIDNVLGDLINSIELLVKKVFRGVYTKIYESAMASLSK